jgi:hypothetical protein
LNQQAQKNRIIERRALKGACMKVLYQTFLTHVGIGDNLGSPPSYLINENQYIQFYEQVFEWQEMSWQYTISLHQQSSKTISLKSIIQRSNADDVFTEFLQADLAQVFVPVHPDHSLKVLYYLNSGMLWQAADQLCPVNPEHIELASELKKLEQLTDDERTESEPWEIKIPTSMMVLDEEGSLDIR